MTSNRAKFQLDNLRPMTDGLLARQEILLDNFHSLNETLKEEKDEIARVEQLLTNQTIELVQLEHGEGELFSGLTDLQSKFDTVKTEFNSNDKNVKRDLDKLERNMVNMEQELRETIKKHSVEVVYFTFSFKIIIRSQAEISI